MTKARRSGKGGKRAKSYVDKAAAIKADSEQLGLKGLRDAKTAARADLIEHDDYGTTEGKKGSIPDQSRYAGPSPYPPSRMTGPLSAHFHVDGNDAVDALTLVQALQNFFYAAGAERVFIESVRRGSVFAKLEAWLNGDDSAQAKKKFYDLAETGEQWARDVTANKARAEVSAMNASTSAKLLAACEPYDNIAMQVDDFLIIKTTASNGGASAVVQKLTIKAMQLLEENPAILSDPQQALDKLSLLNYAKGNDLRLEP
ncbi:hypothetical protein JTF08_03280 [Micrococcaceae bacterium RIT802]|nr:hypothetical protein [Micrococcaceae bacterium RIT 802]